MELKIQIISLIYSFIYGVFFSIMLNINYKNLYHSRKHIKIISTIIFVFVNVLIYFLILKRINNGMIHPYLLIAFLFGNLIDNGSIKLVANLFKK